MEYARPFCLLFLCSLFVSDAVLAAAPTQSATENRYPFAWNQVKIKNPVAKFAPKSLAVSDKLDLLYYLPKNPIGVAYILHGGGGSVATWADSDEGAVLITDLVRKGVGVVLPESPHREADRHWNIYDPEELPSADPVGAFVASTINGSELLIRLIHQTMPTLDPSYPSAGPIALIGFSSGSRVAQPLGHLLRRQPPTKPNDISPRVDIQPDVITPGEMNIAAVVMYQGAPRGYYFGVYDANRNGNLLDDPSPVVDGSGNRVPYKTPILVNYSQNDDSFPPAQVEAVLFPFQSQGTLDLDLGNGQCLESRYYAAGPLTPDRMARCLGISYTESRLVFETLQFEGFLNGDHTLRYPPFTIENGNVSAQVLPSSIFSGSPTIEQRSFAPFSDDKKSQIRDQLNAVYGAHTLNSALHKDSVEFVVQHFRHSCP